MGRGPGYALLGALATSRAWAGGLTSSISLALHGGWDGAGPGVVLQGAKKQPLEREPGCDQSSISPVFAGFRA